MHAAYMHGWHFTCSSAVYLAPLTVWAPEIQDAALVSQAIEEQHLSRAQSGAQDEQNSGSTSYGSDGSSSSGADMDIEVCHMSREK